MQDLETMQFILFFAVWLLLIATAHYYVGKRTIPHCDVSVKGQRKLWGLLWVVFLIPEIPFFLLVGGIETWWNELLSWIGYVLLGAFSMSLSLIAVRDLWLVFWKFLKRLSGRPWGPRLSKSGTDYERRRLLFHSTNMGAVGLATVVSGYGVYESHRKAVVEDVSIPMDNLPMAFNGFRIVQISDIHIGPTIKRAFVERIVRQVNDLKPDLIAFTGDLVDGTVAWLRDDVAPLRELSSPYGLFFVTGNHDYYSGAGPWIKEAERIGFDPLINEHRIISRSRQSLILAGITDFTAEQFIPSQASDPAKAFKDSPPNLPRILLAHQPKSIFAAADVGCDLQLSGHTHGGQFFPWNFMVTLGQPFIAGLHKLKDTLIYVNRGIGYWGPPVRVGIPPEITVLELTHPAQNG